jgi:hypothetical protein
VKKSRRASRPGVVARVAALAFVLIALGVTRALAQPAAAALSADDAKAIGTDAYIFGYPLVTMEYTRRVMTNIAQPVGTKAPMGQLVRMRTYPNASFRDVTAPNADTLYTTGWIDVSKEPYVLQLVARTRGQVRSDAADVLAQGNSALAARWDLDDSGSETVTQ